MKVRHLTAILMLGLVSCEPSVGDKPATGFLDQSVLVEGTEYLYQIYVPRQYDGRSETPLILYLHGCGFDRWGNDGSRHTRFALGDTIRADPQKFPAIVIFPQMPLRTHWLGLGNQVARSALERTIAAYEVDESRLYLMGFSCGGNGVWKLAFEDPERFAALVPVAGWARWRDNGRGTVYPAIAPERGPNEFAAVARKTAEVPTWIIHGADDVQVDVIEARGMADARGASARYTEMVDVAHIDAISEAFRVEGLFDWLFRQQRIR